MMIRIHKYKSKYLHNNRPEVVKYLLNNLNNDIEESKDEDGWLIGSAMVDDLREERKQEIWLAWKAGTIIAWGNLSPRYDDEFYPGYQVSMYVSPRFRGKGIAGRILEKMKTFAASKNKTIWCCPWDAKGEAFYLSNVIEELPDEEWETGF